ncbi:MAG: selenide, water dikinase SelD [Planctomycetota bacterium]|jgi:selenide,water dikinase
MKVDLFTLDCECGCAAKVPADQISGILRDLDIPGGPEVVIGPQTLDDAGVYRLSNGQCLVQTVDYFPPVARDPYVYGQIAAANSLSDVYAMGADPLTALAVVCFPAESLGVDVLSEITRGAADKLREAGVVLLGGHSVVDPQPKYGLCVTGVVSCGEIIDNAHARPGDALILTKPLGTGLTIMAVKAGMADAEREDTANRCMAALNRDAARIAREHGVSSCTDITGFGFLGHACQMARASGVSMEIFVDHLPKLAGVVEYAATGLLSGAAYANRRYVSDGVTFAEDISLAEQDLLFDPQTSGGLLACCPHETADAMLEAARGALSTECAIVGTVIESEEDSQISVKRRPR